MLQLLKVKAHRKKFIKQITILFTCFLLSIALLFYMKMNYYVTEFQNNTQKIFENNETNLQASYQQIESFITRVYSDNLLLKDFLRYFNNNAERYLSLKLDNVKTEDRNVDFVNECMKFVRETDYAVKEIVLRSQYSCNIIECNPNENFNFKFNIQSKKVNIPQNDITYGLVYSKALPYPNNISSNIGDIIFVLRPEVVFSQPANNMIVNQYIVNHGGCIQLSGTEQSNNNSIINRIINSQYSKGHINHIFYSIQFLSSTLEPYDIEMIAFRTTLSILKENLNSFIIIIVFCCIGFIIVFFYMCAKLKKDIKFIQDIVTSINEAKCGTFTHTNFKHRDDEYGLIAEELNKMSVKINDYIEKEYILKINQQEAEMKALQNQINPHFLYNTLEIIRSKALMKNDIEVSKAISNLGNLYRNIVKAHNEITIEKEISILKEYLELMEFKYSSNFCYQIDLDDETLQLSTIKLWMQPIVENFIQHGLNIDSEYNLLIILGKHFDTYFQIQFIDNGVQLDQDKLDEVNMLFKQELNNETKEPSGLKNVFNRLNKFYKGKVKMQIKNNESAGITTTIRINK